MKSIQLSIVMLTMAHGVVCSSVEPAIKDKGIKPSLDSAQMMLDEMNEMSRRMQQSFDELPEKIHKNFKNIAHPMTPEVFLEARQDDHFVILSLIIKGAEHLDVGKDIAIDVDDNLLIVQVPVKKGKVAVEIYDNRLTVFQSYEMKKEKKDQDSQFLVTSSQSVVQTQLLPSRVDVTNVAAISAEYKEKDQKLILKLPKKLARKIAIKASAMADSSDREK